MAEKNLQNLQKLLALMDSESFTQEDFIKSFEMVLEIVSQTKKMTEEEVANLRTMFTEAQSELKFSTTERFDMLKSRVLSEMTETLNKTETKLLQTMSDLTSRMDDLEEPDDEEEQDLIDRAVETTLSKIPPSKELKPETKESIREKLLPIEIEDVNNLKDELNIREQKINENIQSIRLMRGGGSKGIQLYVGGVKKGLAQYVDIIAGSGMTITDSVVNGLHSITFASSGGSGFTQLSATETPDGSRKTFTFSSATTQPSFLVVDNVWMKATTALGTVNWTWNGGTKVATLTIPAVDDIWAVAG